MDVKLNFTTTIFRNIDLLFLVNAHFISDWLTSFLHIHSIGIMSCDSQQPLVHAAAITLHTLLIGCNRVMTRLCLNIIIRSIGPLKVAEKTPFQSISFLVYGVQAQYLTRLDSQRRVVGSLTI